MKYFEIFIFGGKLYLSDSLQLVNTNQNGECCKLLKLSFNKYQSHKLIIVINNIPEFPQFYIETRIIPMVGFKTISFSIDTDKCFEIKTTDKYSKLNNITIFYLVLTSILVNLEDYESQKSNYVTI